MTAADRRAFWEANAERVFALRYNEKWSYGRIADDISSDLAVSSETIRKVVHGVAHGDITETLRQTYASHVKRRVEPLTGTQYRGVFVGYHERKESLSEIARSLGGGWDYARVRRVLKGEGEYEQPTAKLRGVFPEYEQRTGRGARSVVPDWKLKLAFRLYFEEDYSLNDIRVRTGIPREQFRALVVGEEDAERTVELRARYGTELRPPGRPIMAATG